MNDLSPEQKVILSNIEDQIEECFCHYIGQPVTSYTLERLKVSLNPIFEQYREHASKEFSEHIDITVNPNDCNVVVFCPKSNAPQWVLDIFHKINILVATKP